jgi:hypothetical protein
MPRSVDYGQAIAINFVAAKMKALSDKKYFYSGAVCTATKNIFSMKALSFKLVR